MRRSVTPPLGERRSFLAQALSYGATVRDPEAAVFNGGEGLFYHAGLVYFSTQGDDRVWRCDAVASTVTVAYDSTVGPG